MGIFNVMYASSFYPNHMKLVSDIYGGKKSIVYMLMDHKFIDLVIDNLINIKNICCLLENWCSISSQSCMLLI